MQKGICDCFYLDPDLVENARVMPDPILFCLPYPLSPSPTVAITSPGTAPHPCLGHTSASAQSIQTVPTFESSPTRGSGCQVQSP